MSGRRIIVTIVEIVRAQFFKRITLTADANRAEASADRGGGSYCRRIENEAHQRDGMQNFPFDDSPLPLETLARKSISRNDIHLY